MTTWEIIAAILVPLLGIISGLLGVKWWKGLKLLKESGEAVVAFGMGLLTAHKVLEDPTITEAEKQEVKDAIKRIGSEFSDVARAATDLVSKGS